MFWFKNVMIYRLSKPIDWNELQPKLQANQFFPCQQSDISHFGWISPLKGSELLHFSANNQILLVAHKEEKILPATVVKKALEERIDELEQKQQRKLQKVEKQALKDDVIASLLPRAFSKYQHTALWIDCNNQFIYVDAASSKRAEDCLALLRKTLGSLPVLPLAFANEPSLVLTDWIKQNSLPQWLTSLDEAELKGQNEQAVIRCKNQPLDSEEILTALSAGKQVTKLALEWENHLSFIFHQEGSLKRIKFAEDIRSQNDDILKEDYAQRFDADFLLMTSELAKLTENLIQEFGGEKERIG